MNSLIADLALDAIVQNPTSELWVFTDSELEQFAHSIVSECITVGQGNGDLIKQHFGVKT